MRYWLYESAKAGTRAGYVLNWAQDPLTKEGPRRWGGHYSTMSSGVARRFTDDAFVGDVVVAYQADQESMGGFLQVVAMVGPRHGETMHVRRFYKRGGSFQIRAHENRDRLSCCWRLRRGERSAVLRFLS